ncbi:hypothetical protein NG798_08280 [Ancylothrix sp. C2]|uniref:hypothetical protein n=1 Tax=Ancylothrix sp. D3o TaxID=2953691 RepID=UPI0021BB6861|nr:hypothetical protein [Ancylothrix sp. D3o]MCT7949782.1 hypothetical protein [Ancylothrix sp. D3o]
MNKLNLGLESQLRSAANILEKSRLGRWVEGAIVGWFYISREFARSYTILSAPHPQSQRIEG